MYSFLHSVASMCVHSYTALDARSDDVFIAKRIVLHIIWSKEGSVAVCLSVGL